MSFAFLCFIIISFTFGIYKSNSKYDDNDNDDDNSDDNNNNGDQ